MKTLRHISYEKLHKMFTYNPETGLLKRKRNKQVVGTLNGKGYLDVSIEGKNHRVHRVCYCMYHGYWPENDIDHINQIKTDNRIKNLREVSRSCNMRNSKLHTNSSSGVKGVSWNKQRKKWKTYITINNKNIYVGFFKDFDSAVMARYIAELNHNWHKCEKESSAYKYLVENDIIKPVNS